MTFNNLPQHTVLMLVSHTLDAVLTSETGQVDIVNHDGSTSNKLIQLRQMPISKFQSQVHQIF